MLRHLSTLIIRMLRKKPLYTSVNILGLSLGVLTAGLVYAFVRNELSYDRFHDNVNSTYRVDSFIKMPALENPEFRYPSLSGPLIDKIRAEVPGIARSTRFMKSFGPEIIVRSETQAFTEKLTYVDNDFFSIFSFKLLKGDVRIPLKDPSQIILTESIAKKYFGSEDPINKILEVIDSDERKHFTVVGIISDPPQNSSITFTMLVPMESWKYYNEASTAWTEHNYTFFVQLKDQIDSTSLQTSLDRISKEAHESIISKGNTYRATITALSEIHWNTLVPWDGVRNPESIPILIGVVVIVIAIACINFIVLSMINSSTRTKEIGIKKIVGAHRGGIVFQFMLEALVFTTLASSVGLLLIALVAPNLDSVLGTSVRIRFDLMDAIFLTGVIIIVSILAGFYPAMVFSTYNPGQILKGSAVLKTRSSLVFVLVLIQFSLSLFLAGCSFIMTGQMTYINNKDLGFDHDQVIVLPTFASDGEAAAVIHRFKSEASREPLIISVSSCSNPFFAGMSRMGYGDKKSARAYFVDSDFIQTMGIKLKAGRNFNGSSADSSTVIINQQLATDLGEDVLNQVFYWGGDQSSEIIGITHDFNYRSLEFPIQPVFLTMSSAILKPSTLLIKVRPEQIEESLLRIEEIFRAVNPEKPFQYKFLSDSVDKLYASYRMWTTIVTLANICIAIIACVGLFGLAGVEVGNHYKEIGIRKAFGASSLQIFRKIIKRYVWLIIIASIVGAPLSYRIMNDWISKFAYKIDITWQVFALVILVGLLLTIVSVGYHSLRGANLNPAETLKHKD